MRRCFTPAFVVVAAMSLPLNALADQPNCPPGSWFCANDANDGSDPGQQAPSQAPTQPPQVDAAPPPPVDALPPPPPPAVVDEPEEDARPLPPPTAAPPAVGRHRTQPPVVIYQPAPSSSPPPQIIIIAPGGARTRVVRSAPPPPPMFVPAAPPAPPPVPLMVRPRWRSEWGLNLRLEGISMGGTGRNGTSGASPNAGMGGFGLSLRYRPVPAFAFDAGIDVVGGTDYNGFQRVEMPLSLNGMLYLNPRSRAQVYFTGGVHWSHATVSSGSPDPRLSSHPEDNNYSTEYSYFGGQGGIGLEFRVSRRVGLNLDALAFVRKRTDDGKATNPEFVDAQTGRTTNTSGGGLFRGGLTFWW
jgi:hypothetical protein